MQNRCWKRQGSKPSFQLSRWVWYNRWVLKYRRVLRRAVHRAWNMLLVSLKKRTTFFNFTEFCKFCHEESKRYDSNMFGLISILFKYESYLDLNKGFPTFNPKSKSWKLWKCSWNKYLSVWEVLSLFFQSYVYTNFMGFPHFVKF